MSEEELTELLWELYQSENADADYMVLPDDYEYPAEGKTGIYNLLLLGIDNPGDSITGRSDTMLLASLNALTGELKLVSFMRDTYVTIPKHGHNKLNAAFAYGGAELLIETLEKNFGVTVDGYLAVNYQTMADLVDAIGGIDMTVTKAEMKKLNGILEYYNIQRGADSQESLLETFGALHLNGLQTMSFARIRKLDSDFVRVQRQQKVILAIYEQIGTLSLSELVSIAGVYIGKVDTDVTLAKAISLVTNLVKYDDLSVETLRVPSDGAYHSETVSGTYYIMPKLNKCRKELNAFLYE